MYLALYRKWRPLTFDDVISQEHISTILKNQVKQNKVAHAYLFTGSRGTGKTSCSKILAKAVNCPNVQDGEPCLTCETCKGIDDGSIMDVLEIDAASNNGVDNIRDLREEASFTPAVCQYRVYIIDEAHMLSTGAFNALLKIMEEPPSHVLFILATTEVHKVPATIVSRCQRFDFRRIRPEDIAKRLLSIASVEGFTLEPEAADLIARLADGGMRDALSLLDQCVAFSNTVDLETVSSAAGIAGREYLFDLAECIHKNNVSQGLEILDSLYRKSKDLERLCEELIQHMRNLMLAKTTSQYRELIICLPAELEALKACADSMQLPEILHCLSVLQDTLVRLSRTTNKRLEFEMAIVKLCSPSLDVSKDSILRRLEQLEDYANHSKPILPAGEDKPAEKSKLRAKKTAQEKQQAEEPPKPAGNQADAIDSSKVFQMGMWPDIVAELQNIDKPLAGTLNGSIAYEYQDILFIESLDPFFSILIRQEGQLSRLKQAVFQKTGRQYRIRLKTGQNNMAQQEVEFSLDDLAKKAQESGIEVNFKEE